MKTTINTLAMMLATVTPVLAANDAVGNEIGLLGILFLGFGAMIITFQLIPALMLFVALVKGVFAAVTTNATATHQAK